MVPAWFKVHLLRDLLPLLEAAELVFDTAATHQLLRVLEGLVSSHRSRTYLGPAVEEPAQLEPLRLALARNLSRALLVPK